MDKVVVRESLKMMLDYIEADEEGLTTEIMRQIAGEAVLNLARETGFEANIKAYIWQKIRKRNAIRQKQIANQKK